jgi:hypothetical protein
MRTRLMIASAATAALLAGAALAQNAPANDTAVNPPLSGPAPAAAGDAASAPTPDTSSASAPGVSSPSSDAATVAPAAGAPTQRASSSAPGTDVISNGPVPDTKANRAKYGQPLSHAGKMTKAAGN